MAKRNRGKGNARKTKSAQSKRIRLCSYVKTLPDKFKILVVAISRDDNLVLAGGKKITFFDGLQRTIKSGVSDPKGRVRLAFELPLEKAGEKISIRAELDGTKFNDEIQITLPTPNKGRRLRLYPGEIKEVNGKFVLPLEVMVVEPNETPANNIEVEFIDFNNKVFSVQSTVNGKAATTYTFPLKHGGESLKFRARIKGTVHETPPELVTIPRARYTNISYRESVRKHLKGLNKNSFLGFNPLKYKQGTWELIKNNLAKETKAKLFSKIAVMYLIAAVVLYALQVTGPRWSAIPIAIAIMFGIAALPGKFTLGLGSVYAGIFFAISMLVPELTIGAVSSAAYMYLIMGPPTYLYEKLSRKDDGSKNNIYPWLMIKLCWIIGGFYVGYGVYSLALGHNAYLDSIRSFLENDAISGYGKRIMVEVNHKIPKIKHGYAYALKIKAFVISLVMATSWVFASVIIFIPTSFGEFKDYLELKITGKGKEGSSASHVGIYFLLDTLLERALRVKK